MKDYTGIREVKVFDDADNLNSALRKNWVLLDIAHFENKVFFIAGRYFITETDFSSSAFKREGTI
ncbi:MAG: hypothetical protein IJP96_13230 [Synergistaceae bacterium]|nr:hypothetical protein [Synergistaceae bacterium]